MPVIHIHSASGSGATAIAVFNPTGVGAIGIDDGGAEFTSVPLVSIVGGGGAGATAVIELAGTSIASIELNGGGSNYTTPVVTITDPTGDGTAAATANLGGAGVGPILSITLTNGGNGYTNPSVAITDSASTGSGAGATAFLTPTTIAGVVVSAIGQYYTSVPTVQVALPGSGTDAASATVDLMPFGVSGSAMETFLSRVWIVDPATQPFAVLPAGGNYSFSAAGSFIDFASSDGGGFGSNADDFLQSKYNNIRQTSGYLYFMGNGSVSVVSNVQTSGSPSVTTYNYQNVDPQSGIAWRDTLSPFGRSLLFANSLGIFGLYGGAVTKVSGKIDQLFTNAIFPDNGGIIPSSAVADIYSVKHYLTLMTVLQTVPALSGSGAEIGGPVVRNVMVTWNEKDWTISSQSLGLTSIGTQQIDSDFHAWGTDGTRLFPLFTTPSSKLLKRWDTKIYGGDRMFIQKTALATWLAAQDNSSGAAGISGNLTLNVSGLALFPKIPAASQPPLVNGLYQTFNLQPSFLSPAPGWGLWGTSMGGVHFVMAGLIFISASPDFTIANIAFGYNEEQAYFGQ
jgi:hypothetical protein